MTSIQTLENGLRVSVTERPESPVVSLYLWFNVGSCNEPPGLYGAAHVIEHMLFKGSANYGLGEAAGTIEGFGGDINAYTSFEQTVLHATVMAPKWAEALDVLLDMALRPRFDQEEFRREKLVILEEVRGALGEPDYLIDLEIQNALFPEHGYGRAILGTQATVEALDRDTLASFWQAHYNPSRAILAVAGPVKQSSVEEFAKRKTADWLPREVAGPTEPTAKVSLPFISEITGDFATHSIQVGWALPPVDHPDIAAIDIFLAYLAQGRASVLNERLEINRGIAHGIWGYLLPRTGASLANIGMTPNQHVASECIAILFEELERIICTGIDESDLERTRNAVLADFLFGAETVDDVAHDAAWYTAYLGSPSARETYRRRLTSISPDDIQRVAATFFHPSQCAVSYLAPDLEFSTVQALTRRDPKPETPIKHNSIPHSKPRQAAMKPTPGPEQRIVLENGATVLLLPDTSPIAAFRLTCLGGGLTETAKTAGLTSAWSQMLLSGAGSYDAGRFARQVELLAGEISGVSGRNTVGISGSFPTENLLDGIELLQLLLLEPHFNIEQWRFVHEELREYLHTIEDRPSDIAARELSKRLWSGHPWAIPASGTLSSLRRISRRRILQCHEQHFHANNIVVAVSGGFDSTAVLERLEQALVLPRNDLFPPPRPALKPLKSDTVRLRGGHEQSTLVIGTRAFRIDQEERHALELATAILGGQGGRMFMELREKHSLAYSVWSHAYAGLDGGQLVAGLATEPARADEAAERLMDELHKLAVQSPSMDELLRNRRMLAGHAAMGLQRAADRASEASIGERLAFPWRFDDYCQALDRVSPDDVSSALRSALDTGIITVRVDPRAE